MKMHKVMRAIMFLSVCGKTYKPAVGETYRQKLYETSIDVTSDTTPPESFRMSSASAEVEHLLSEESASSTKQEENKQSTTTKKPRQRNLAVRGFTKPKLAPLCEYRNSMIAAHKHKPVSASSTRNAVGQKSKTPIIVNKKTIVLKNSAASTSPGECSDPLSLVVAKEKSDNTSTDLKIITKTHKRVDSISGRPKTPPKRLNS